MKDGAVPHNASYRRGSCAAVGAEGAALTPEAVAMTPLKKPRKFNSDDVKVSPGYRKMHLFLP